MEDYFEDYVIFNFPKDIVGGDFHWFKSQYKAVAIADCTGHGFQAVLSPFWAIYLLNLQQGTSRYLQIKFYLILIMN